MSMKTPYIQYDNLYLLSSVSSREIEVREVSVYCPLGLLALEGGEEKCLLALEGGEEKCLLALEGGEAGVV